MAPPLRIRLLGDHSAEHCGCRAVTEVLMAELGRVGEVVGPFQEFDALVVNGEGSMHHGRRPWLTKMDALRMAQVQGKRTWLVNSVWDSNPSDFDDVLRGLDGLWLRGPASARDLHGRHGIAAPHRLDLSFQCPVDEEAAPIPGLGPVCMTDVYAEGLSFVWLDPSRGRPWSRVDLRTTSWSSLVNSLRGRELLITGRHHAVYAACRARLPFVALRGNSHKVEDLLQSARSPIPVAEALTEIEPLIKWARGNRGAYEDLFDWMEAQAPWRFDPEARPSAPPPPPPPSLLDRATAALHRRAFAAAHPLWAQLLEARGAAIPTPRNAAMAFFGAGDADRALRVLARATVGKPQSFIFTRMLADNGRHPTLWAERGPGPAWWLRLRDAAHLARAAQDAGPAFALAREALALAEAQDGAPFAACARFLLCCKLVQLNRHDMAAAIEDECPIGGVPDWILRQHRILAALLGRRFDAPAEDAVAGAERLEAWADPALRATVFRYRLLRDGPEAVAGPLAESVRAFPAHPELREVFYTASSETGDWGVLGDLSGPGSLGRPALRGAAARQLGVARLLARRGAGGEPEIAARDRLLRAFEEGRDELMARLSDPARRIAVVGNSPVELGRGRGAEIDAHDLVVRFNDFSTAPPFDLDYGRRCDVHLRSSPPTAAMLEKAGPAGPVIVLRHAFHLFEPRDWEPFLDAAARGQRFAYLPRDAFIEAAGRVGRSPSAGMVFALLLRKLRGRIDRGDFYGFSMTDQIAGARRAHYFDAGPPSLLHDWEAEAAAFAALFAG